MKRRYPSFFIFFLPELMWWNLHRLLSLNTYIKTL
nr:MAG TPA: hypothetical protein [Caudoviricetes sp.]